MKYPCVYPLVGGLRSPHLAHNTLNIKPPTHPFFSGGLTTLLPALSIPFRSWSRSVRAPCPVSRCGAAFCAGLSPTTGIVRTARPQPIWR